MNGAIISQHISVQNVSCVRIKQNVMFMQKGTKKMKMNEYYKDRYYGRKATGMCVVCGTTPAISGKTRCEFCAKRNNYLCRTYRANQTQEQIESRKIYMKEWRKNNPDKMEVYKNRRLEQNRRYGDGYEL